VSAALKGCPDTLRALPVAPHCLATARPGLAVVTRPARPFQMCNRAIAPGCPLAALSPQRHSAAVRTDRCVTGWHRERRLAAVRAHSWTIWHRPLQAKVTRPTRRAATADREEAPLLVSVDLPAKTLGHPGPPLESTQPENLSNKFAKQRGCQGRGHRQTFPGMVSRANACCSAGTGLGAGRRASPRASQRAHRARPERPRQPAPQAARPAPITGPGGQDAAGAPLAGRRARRRAVRPRERGVRLGERRQPLQSWPVARRQRGVSSRPHG
jgi:hypothetical protein